MFGVSSTILESKAETKLNGQIVFDLGCYNHELFKWEPIIEKFGAKIDLSLQNTPRININISNLDDFPALNANISDHMVKSFIISNVLSFRFLFFPL